MTRECDGLLLDVGVVVALSPWELADLFEESRGLPPRTFPGRGPFDTAEIGRVDERWEAYKRAEITEREYWMAFSDASVANGAPLEGHPHLMRTLLRAAGPRGVRPEAMALVASARAAGIRTGFLSNELFDFHDKEWVVAQPWFQEVDFAVDSSEVGVRKPAPEPYEVAIEQSGMPPERVVFIDDSPAYVEGGLRAGLRCVLLDVLEPWKAFDEAAALLGLPPIGRLATAS